MFYDNLKKICDERNEKLTPILKKLGFSTGNPVRWQAGGNVSSDILLALSEYLDVSTDYLLTGKEYVHIQDKRLCFTKEECDLISMYRILPPAYQEFIFNSIKTAYIKELSNREKEKKLPV